MYIYWSNCDHKRGAYIVVDSAFLIFMSLASVPGCVRMEIFFQTTLWNVNFNFFRFDARDEAEVPFFLNCIAKVNKAPSSVCIFLHNEWLIFFFQKVCVPICLQRLLIFFCETLIGTICYSLKSRELSAKSVWVTL